MRQSETFKVLGIQHQNASIEVREGFSLSEDSIKNIYQEFDSNFEGGLFIISTCNRTELWIHSTELSAIKKSFLQKCAGSTEMFEEYSFQMEGNEAIRHIFRVSGGLDSQII